MQAPQTLNDTLAAVREYYGKTLQSSADLKTNACCTTDALPRHIRSILTEIEDEVLTKFYGCGSPLPLALEGATILDLGCGTGRDAFIASRLVGPDGFVVGIDMTAEQLAVARRNVTPQMNRFGFRTPNVEFREGYIEDLSTASIKNNSVDVVISNCVINLSPRKDLVFEEIFRVLKPGGELYFSDVFADRRIPEVLAEDPVMHGECLGGAMYFEDFRRMLAGLGIADIRTVSTSDIEIGHEELADRAGNIRFTSRTIRAFKLGPDLLEDQCENYGQVARYLGTIPESPHSVVLDDHHVFERGLPVPVCGNTAAMLENTRFADFFEITGDRSEHFGLFDCAPTSADSVAADCGC